MCEEDVEYEVSRKRVKPSCKSSPHAVNNIKVDLTPRELYKFEIYYAICDALMVHLSSHKVLYHDTFKKFSCLTLLKEKNNI